MGSDLTIDYVVQGLPGLTDIRATLLYVRLADKRLHEAVNREGKTNARIGDFGFKPI